MSKYLVSPADARPTVVGSSASKVLLALLLVRELGVALGQPEFAKLAGLPRPSTDPLVGSLAVWEGLHEIEQAQLVVIIAQNAEIDNVLGDHEEVAVVPDQLVLGSSATEAANSISETARPGGTGLAASGIDPAFIGTRTATLVPALQELWDEVFPVAEYPVQRLTKETAKTWIRKYGDDFVREVLIDVRHTTTKKIESPRGYVSRVLESQWEKRSAPVNSGESEITDELRELTRMGRRQHAARHL